MLQSHLWLQVLAILYEQTSDDLDMWSQDERHIIIKLLRREQAYQRARVRRIVKQQQRYILDRTCKHGRVVMAKDNCGPFILAYDLLAALDQRTT